MEEETKRTTRSRGSHRGYIAAMGQVKAGDNSRRFSQRKEKKKKSPIKSKKKRKNKSRKKKNRA